MHTEGYARRPLSVGQVVLTLDGVGTVEKVYASGAFDMCMASGLRIVCTPSAVHATPINVAVLRAKPSNPQHEEFAG